MRSWSRMKPSGSASANTRILRSRRLSRRFRGRTPFNSCRRGPTLGQELGHKPLGLSETGHFGVHSFDRLEQIVEAWILRHGGLTQCCELLSDRSEFSPGLVPDEYHYRKNGGRQRCQEAKQVVDVHISLRGTKPRSSAMRGIAEFHTSRSVTSFTRRLPCALTRACSRRALQLHERRIVHRLGSRRS